MGAIRHALPCRAGVGGRTFDPLPDSQPGTTPPLRSLPLPVHSLPLYASPAPPESGAAREGGSGAGHASLKILPLGKSHDSPGQLTERGSDHRPPHPHTLTERAHPMSLTLTTSPAILKRCPRSCSSQCDGCHSLDNCVPAVHRLGDLLLCTPCHRTVPTEGMPYRD